MRPNYAGGHSYKPYTTYISKGYDGEISTDRYGFIHNGDKDRLIKEGAIFAFGGSTLAGIGSGPNEKTIPAIIE